MKALYFSHDYSARNDERVLEIRAEWGWEGYGLYFGVVEMMAENGGHLNSTKLGAVALGLAVELPKLKQFIQALIDIGLLYDEAGLLRSRRLDKHFAYREQCAEAGRRGGQNSWVNRSENKPPLSESEAPLQEIQSDPSTSARAEPEATNKEKKESKEIKEKRMYFVSQSPPTEQQVIDYFVLIGSNEIEAVTFFDHFTANGWKVGGKAPMKDWKAAARNWKRNSNKFNRNGSNTDKREQRVNTVAAFGR